MFVKERSGVADFFGSPMMMGLHAELDRLGLALPQAPRPVATYVPAVYSGGLIYVSGQLPFDQGRLTVQGAVPSGVSLAGAQQGARQCVLNALAIVDGELNGDWTRFIRIVRVGVFVASESDFTEQSLVANGASELLGQLFGTAGEHARVAVGVNVLPLGAAVEVEMTVEVE